jgi:hypothetical protein
MILIAGVMFPILFAAVAGGTAAWRRCAAWEPHFRILAAMLPGGLLFVAMIWICAVLSAPENYWNQARLAPLFSLRYGYHLYYPPGEGPVTGAIYGPISYLAYFPSLAASSPIPSLLIGSMTASIYYFAPAAWIFLSGMFRQGEARIVGLSLFILFGLWTIGTQPLFACSFNIHADAPALGFAAIACGLLMRETKSQLPVWLLALSAIFIGLSIFSKQSLVFLAPTLVCFVWFTSGRRSALQFAALMAATFTAMLAVFCILFSARALYFNLYAFPSNQGFGHKGVMQIPSRTAASVIETFIWAGQDLWTYCRWPIFALGVCSVIEISMNHPKQFVLREWLSRNRWTVFQFVALAGLPFAWLFHAKVGGNVNNLAVHLYFCIIGLLLFCGHLILRHPTVARPVVAAYLILAATFIPAVFEAPHFVGLIRSPWTSRTEQVYEYTRRHPGETFFSWYPLPVLMAEGRMDHFEYGVFDRALGLAPITEDHFLKFIPPHMKYLSGIYELDGPISKYLPSFRCPVQLPGFPDMLVYAECAAQDGFLR